MFGAGNAPPLGCEFGPHPMDPAQDERRVEPAVARRRDIERHIRRRQRLQAAPQPCELGMVDAGADPTGVSQPVIRIVVGEQQRLEPGPRAFRIGPTDHDEFLVVQTFDLEPQTAIPRGVGRIGPLRAMPSSFKSHA